MIEIRQWNETNQRDIIGGLPQISCPINHYIYNASTGIIKYTRPETKAGISNINISVFYVVQSVILLLLLGLSVFKYGGIRLFSRNIKFKSVRMHLFAWSFASAASFSIIDATRYSLNLPYYIFLANDDLPPPGNDGFAPGNIGLSIFFNEDIPLARSDSYYRYVDSAFLLASTVLRALTLLLLSLALYWSYRYRTKGLIEENENITSNRNSNWEIDGRLSGAHNEYDNPEESLNNAEFNNSDKSPLLVSIGISRSPHEASHEENRSILEGFFYRRRGGVNYFSFDRIFLCLFLVHLVFLYLNITPIPPHEFFSFMFLITFTLLQIPIFICTILILSSKTAASSSSARHILQITRGGELSMVAEGPKLIGKIYLILAVIFGISGSLPPELITILWFKFSQKTLISDNIADLIRLDLKDPEGAASCDCMHVFGYRVLSVVDLIMLAQTISFLFYFGFMRSEFTRVKDFVVLWVVSRLSGVFGWSQGS